MTDSAIISQPIGSPGLPAQGGRIRDEWDKRLTGDKLIKTYIEMGADPTVRSMLFAFEILARSAGYRIEPADETPEAQAEADFVDSALREMDGAWGDTLSEVLSVWQFGFALFEPVYKRRLDGRVGWARWSPRPQETILEWTWDPDWNLTGVVQYAPPSYQRIPIPIAALLHFQNQPRKQNPAGTSLLRPMYESWYYIKHIQKIEAIGIERDLAGLPVIGVPIEVYKSAPDLESWILLGTELRRDERACIVKPNVYDQSGKEMYTFSLASTGGQRQIDTDPILARYERKMLRSGLADFLTQGDTGVGSYAQNVSRTDLFTRAATAMLDSPADVINQQAIPKLYAWNSTPKAVWPRFVFNELGTKDILAFANTLAVLISGGIVDPADQELRQHIYDMIGLPMPAKLDAPVRVPVQIPSLTPTVVPAPGTTRTAVAATGPRTFAATSDGQEPDEATKRAIAAFDKIVGSRYSGMLEAEVTAA